MKKRIDKDIQKLIKVCDKQKTPESLEEAIYNYAEIQPICKQIRKNLSTNK